jgi:hypothetical protein
VTGVGGVSPALWYFRYMLLNGLCWELSIICRWIC